ncbi:di-N-acetylchitobiase-like [Scyliorhinus canicula]|uniref:di-N-acetylchitobiase-like n=1 Tax=Scyliorhinus canicula TaxID=7830 RepID=UPI0018F49CAF|nr:di-N-acetylchitobiase-like [Scyliorhinus canicula]
MRWSLALAQFVAVLVMWIGGASGVSPINFCPCSKRSLCEPLPADHQFQVEVLVFDRGGTDWKHYDWSKLTVIVAMEIIDDELLCHAHEKGVRIVLKGVIQHIHLKDKAERGHWIHQLMKAAKIQFLDGVNLELLEYASNEQALSQLIKQATGVFHHEIPGSQVSLTVPWTPNCPAGKCHHYAAMSKSCDFLFVKSYDIHLQMWDDCFAKANAPYEQTLSGISAYINLGVDPRKLVMGIPWFGHDYTCKRFFEPGRCEIPKDPFKGAPCSSQVARNIPYKLVMEKLSKSFTGKYWDDNYQSPYFVYKEGPLYHEVWYDDPESLSLKATIMKKLKLRGIGALFGNSLNHTSHPMAVMQTENMWNALCPIRRKWRA